MDGIRYVIDAGFCKLKVYNPKIGMDALQVRSQVVFVCNKMRMTSQPGPVNATRMDQLLQPPR